MHLGTPGPLAPSAAPELRLVHSLDEYAACVQLQKETWGAQFNEVVPATILKITNRVGGVVAGAFLEDRLVAFVYGISGIERGSLVHWSHMLAVRPEVRDLGIGRQLKEFQRDILARRGVETILWSFDPLVARNAHLNLNRLGVRVDEYVVDMYPATASDLHAFGTDRFIVAWDIGAAANGGAPSPLPLPQVALDTFSSSPLSVYKAECETENDTTFAGGAESCEPGKPPARVAIEIPQDFEAVAAASAGDAHAWRMATRRAFTTWMGRGYTVTGFCRDIGGRCWYTLAAPARPGGAGRTY